MSFSTLGLGAALQNAAQERAFTAPSAIQQAVIPAILAGRDVLATAQTGSGKTAAFCLPLLELFARQARQALRQTLHHPPRQTQCLILVPTRELAQQVGATLAALGRQLAHPAKLALLFGGVSVNPQMLHLRGGADIVVATPGRLLDLVGKNAVQLGAVAHLVLDEADRLLELGFAEELARILALLPAQRQNLFFSATFAAPLQALARQLLCEPLHVDMAAAETSPDIAQRAIVVDAQQRTQLLRHLFQTEKWPRVLVFVATRYAAETVAAKLRRARISAEPFHGEQSQGKRNQVLSDFKAARVQVVLATDVAARGLDISQLPVVLNYDLPRSADDYLHRIGRTGRAGATGVALSFICADPANEAHFRLIEQRCGQKVTREQVAGFEPALPDAAAPRVQDGNGGVKGKRPNKKDKLRALQAAG